MPVKARTQRGPFGAGDQVQLTDPKGRMHQIVLSAGGTFHTHRGSLSHDDLIGAPEGSVVIASSGTAYVALRPLLADYTLAMKRGATIVYPKDAAQILAYADVFPGARVLEAGAGSGALSCWLLRAIGPDGELVSFEARPDFAEIARENVRKYFGEVPPWWRLVPGELSAEVALDPSARTGAAYSRLRRNSGNAAETSATPSPDGADSDDKGEAPASSAEGADADDKEEGPTTSSAEGGHRGVRGVVPPGGGGVAPDTMAPFAIGRNSGTFDRVVLDMLAPWENVAGAARALIPGGLICCYVATTTQLSRVVEELRAHGAFFEPAAWETLNRGWHVDGLAVRPDHRMIAHTGFLVTSRRLADGVTAPSRRRRPAKGAHPEVPVPPEGDAAPLGARPAPVEAGQGSSPTPAEPFPAAAEPAGAGAAPLEAAPAVLQPPEIPAPPALPADDGPLPGDTDASV
jgi:tRNA A58 N-methylase Trm61